MQKWKGKMQNGRRFAFCILPFSFLHEQRLHLGDDLHDAFFLLHYPYKDVLRLGVVGLLRLDEAEAGEGEVAAVLDDAIRGNAPRDAVGGLALGPFFQEVGEVVAELRAELARFFQR